eukprot:TRINITY_DN38437_c0_g1_i1.p1 TRINITY_DN38437_c0_g1~~TRINITY_DN38437_c0_g1_i1.p1  ORF type:complete len:337 (+),score=55.64 TRINITY_DN38437_c0_g1_i1:63-1013(+)
MTPLSFVSCGALCALLAWLLKGLTSSWSDSKARSYELERQNMSPEDGGYTVEDYKSLMYTIAADNAVDPRGYPATLAAFEALASSSRGPPGSILEVGPGSGDFSRLLATRYPNSSVLGIDTNALSLGVARSIGDMPENLRFELRSSAELSEAPGSIDVLTTTFVNHEIFPDEDFVEFLRRVRTVGRQAFIFNDFVRSFGCLSSMSFMRDFAGYASILPAGLDSWLPGDLKVKARAFLSLPPHVLDFVLAAGQQSMRRAFTMTEYQALFKQAGYPDSALKCDRGKGFYLQDFFGVSCRVTCTADLRFGAAAGTRSDQ